MGKLSNIIPGSYLRQDATQLLKQLKKNAEPLINTQRGRATEVIMGVEAYEKLEHEFAYPPFRLSSNISTGIGCSSFQTAFALSGRTKTSN